MLHRMAVGVIAAMLGALLAAGGDHAGAQDKGAIIKQRQALMKQQAEALKVIQNYVSGSADRDTAIAKVTELLTLPPKITDLFPPGTSMVEFPGATHAKPEIWGQWDRFKDVPSALRRAEQRLADAIKTGSKQDVLDELDTVGRTGCGACHTYFRAPLDD
ncbi:MAG TPA: cytochrome c [Stellaceae bacterium]|nr:cytochrome c [Stellaceae bacterium]